MATIAKITIVGYIGTANGKEIVNKETAEVSKVISFSVAVNYTKKGIDYVDWYDCEVYNRSNLDVLWFEKGKQIFVEGNFRLDNYTSKDGSNKVSAHITVDKLLFLGKKEP
ncbi:MAG: single-stranded DNA-binding protein [Bacteroidetes bacterium]|nr:MAG: single-stranded DNA-binding protein [Bacteroidota bacterium]